MGNIFLGGDLMNDEVDILSKIIANKVMYVHKNDIADLLKIKIDSLDTKLRGFKKEIQKGRYPKMSCIDHTGQTVLVAVMPFLHFLKYYGWLKNKSNEKLIPPYCKEDFTDVM